MKQFILNKNDSGQRLDKFLSKSLKNIPLSLIYKSIRLKKIKVNGKKVALSYMLKEDDVITLYINDEFFEKDKNEFIFTKIKPSLNIIYEDQNIILVDKKQGVLVHSDKNEDINTLINHIKAYLYSKKEYNPNIEHSFSPALCNRIDRNTGGIVIAAKNAMTLRIINEKIKNKEIRKFYLLLVFGIIKNKSGKLINLLEKTDNQNKVFVVKNKTQNSKTAETLYKVLKEKGNISLIEAELLTGRTHQIRAQFADIGHPLVGDTKYATNDKNISIKRKYQALYSYKIIFDFICNAEHLEYLKGKCFEINNVDFVENF